MKAKARDDLAALRQDGRFTNFVKGHTYLCMLNGENFILLDEDKMGFSIDKELFNEYFELQEE